MGLHWSHVFIGVNDLENMLSFYTEVLGFKINDRTESMAFISTLDNEHHQIAFSQLSSDTESNRLGHMAFRVASLGDVQRLYAALRTRPDVKRVSPVTHGNTWSIYFADPENNGIEVFCDTPWETSQPFSEPWDPRGSREAIESHTLRLLEQRGNWQPNPRL